MKALLNKSSFLDPHFKALTHLSQMQQDEVVENITEATEYESNRTEECEVHS